jgi:peptide/nickel transport system substrate-binding protein
LTFHQDRFSKRQSIIPENDAADSWSQISPTVWEFKLNPEVYWHDTPPANGRRVTAEDIKWNIEGLRDKSMYAGSFDIITNVEIVDSATIRIHLSGNYAFLLELLASAGHSFILPEMEDVDGGWANWCYGFGPFKLVEYEAGGPWSLDKHEKYHHFGHTGLRIPYVDGVDVVNLSDTSAGYAAMTTGRIHLMTYSAIGDLRRALQASETIEGQFMPMSPGAQYHLAINLTKAPWDDVRVRRALSMCIDRQAIIDTVYEGSAQTSGQIPFDAVGWNTFPPNNLRGKYLQLNPEAAKQLLTEAGYPDGFETVVAMSPTGPANMNQLETAVYQMKKNCNIEAKIDLMQFVERQKELIDRTYESLSYGFYTPSTNWDSYTYGYMHSKSKTNNFMINDPEIDKLTEAARLTTDREAQIAMYKQVFDLEDENIYRLNLTTPYFYTTYHNFLDNVASGTYTWITSWYSMGKSRIWFKP